MSISYMTQEGYDKLKAELEDLKTRGRDEVAKAIIKKYPKKEELENYIEGFKENLFAYITAFSSITQHYYGGNKNKKTKTMRRKFDRCVRAVQKTVKARKGSTKKQAAYAICTTTILKRHTS